MKISETKFRKLIREEVRNLLSEQDDEVRSAVERAEELVRGEEGVPVELAAEIGAREFNIDDYESVLRGLKQDLEKPS